MVTEASVMICVGSAKSGTSWLHRYLSDHPDCHFRAIKELHYFGGFEGDALARNRARIVENRDRIAASADHARSARQMAQKLKNIADLEHYVETLDKGVEDKAAYLAYLREGAGDAKVVGELTPAYALLPSEKLGDIANLTADTRIVFLMRDPVERLWSHVRMIADQRSATVEEFPDRADGVLRRTIAGKENQIAWRSDYASALSKLTSAVKPAKLLVGLFEDILNGILVARICEFLGIRERQADHKKSINPSRPLAMRPDQRAAAVDWLQPQYQAVEQFFGELPSAWTPSLQRI